MGKQNIKEIFFDEHFLFRQYRRKLYETFGPFLLCPLIASALSYEINFVGIKDEAAIKAMFDASELVTLQDRPPASLNGLRYRIASDIPTLVASSTPTATTTPRSPRCGKRRRRRTSLSLHPPRPQYTLSSYQVFHGDCSELAAVPNCSPFTPEELGLEIASPPFPRRSSTPSCSFSPSLRTAATRSHGRKKARRGRHGE